MKKLILGGMAVVCGFFVVLIAITVGGAVTELLHGPDRARGSAPLCVGG